MSPRVAFVAEIKQSIDHAVGRLQSEDIKPHLWHFWHGRKMAFTEVLAMFERMQTDELDEDVIVGRMADQAMELIAQGGAKEMPASLSDDDMDEIEEFPACCEMGLRPCSPDEIERSIDTSGDSDGE